MNLNDPIVLLLLLGLLVLLVLIVAGGAFWLLRRRAARQKPRRRQPARRQAKKPAPAEKPARPAEAASSPPASAQTATPATAPPPTPPPGPARAESGYALGEGEKIRILVVDDNPDTRGHVSRLLYFEDDMEVIGQATNGRQGVEMAVELKPHIVLMDINMPDMDGITATKEMSLKAPFSQVIIMSVQAEQHYMKQAMAAGARDFQPKPFTSDELINCVRRVFKIGQPMYQQFQAVEQAKARQQVEAAADDAGRPAGGAPVVAVYSPKGGIGVSMLAANLAVSIQQTHGDVLLMDADLQFGDIMVHLNTRPTRTISDLVHDEMLDIELLPDVLLPHHSGLKLLLAPPQPELADAVTAEMVGQVIDGLKKDFRLVLVDTSHKLGDKTMAVLDKADYIVLLTAPELPAIKSAKLFLELADRLEFDSDRVGVVINRANQYGGVSPAKIEKILKLERTFQVPFDSRLTSAINRGVAITQQEPNAPASQAIARIGQVIWDKLCAAQPEVAETPA